MPKPLAALLAACLLLAACAQSGPPAGDATVPDNLVDEGPAAGGF